MPPTGGGNGRGIDAGSEETLPADTGPTPSGAGAPALERSAERPRGAMVGRFVILDHLGRGGMGVVLAAYDPQLDRRVALKLLRPDVWRGADGEQGRARLLREAQAMAKVAHPNVVTVYEAGELGDQLFVAMELVDGETLKAWRKRQPRTWREIVAVFAQAGRGLAAAHDAGLVHRDFKPDNVLVGTDGRVRVGDFGLVSTAAMRRAGAGAPVATSPVTAGPTSSTRDLTSAGAVLGTPAYMSPEQHRGEAVDAAADQYAFCVALWEALYGQRPFPEQDYGALVEAVLSGRVTEPPAGVGAPRRLQAVLRRGLSADPAARWPSMHALLDALAHDPAVRRRRLALAAALAVGVGAVIVWGLAQRGAAASPCRGARDRLAGVWDAARKNRAGEAFTASPVAYAKDTWPRVASRLDAYGDAWVAMHTEACRATRVEDRQSAALFDLRMACLERRRAELGALADQLEKADDDVIENAVEASAALASIDDCADTDALLARAAARRGKPPIAPEWQARLAGVKAQYQVGRYKDGLAAATQLVKDADAQADVAVRAEAWNWLGRLQSELGDFKGAEPSLKTALRLAAEAGDDVLAVHVTDELVTVLDQDKGRFDEALLAADMGQAILVRAGNDELLRAELLVARGSVLGDVSRLDDAHAALTEALALYEKHLAPDDLDLARVVENLANNRHDAGAYDEAGQLHERALAIFQKQLGPDHPKVAQVLNNMGILAMDMGKYEDSVGYYRRALAIKERVFSKDSASVANTMNNLAIPLQRMGKLDEAAALYERALAIRENKLGPEHPLTASTLGNLGSVRRQQGRLDDALALHQRALAIKLKVYGPDHPSVANSHENIGHVLFDRGDFKGAEASYRAAIASRSKAIGPDHPDVLTDRIDLDEALILQNRCGEAAPDLEQVIAGLEKQLGKDHPSLVAALSLLGRCRTDGGKAAVAVPLLERALALAVKAGEDAETQDSIGFELARALWDSGGDRGRALELAARADATLTSPESTRDRARVQAWRRTHSGPR